MAEERLSFVNENFDELQSESSKESLQKNVDGEEQDSPQQPLKNGVDDVPVLENGVGDNEDGVAVLHLSGEEAPTVEVITSSNTGEEKEYNPFAPDSSPIPNSSKDIKTLVGPSHAVATPGPTEVESGGSDHEETSHRSLPAPSYSSKHLYETCTTRESDLRHENTDQYDLQVCKLPLLVNHALP